MSTSENLNVDTLMNIAQISQKTFLDNIEKSGDRLIEITDEVMKTFNGLNNGEVQSVISMIMAQFYLNTQVDKLPFDLISLLLARNASIIVDQFIESRGDEKDPQSPEDVLERFSSTTVN